MLIRDKQILNKILKEISIINEFLNGLTEKNFNSDEKVKRAICMTLINIGELVKNLTVELKENNPQIPWKAVSGLRDITAHKYQTLNMDDVWLTVINDIPRFNKNIETILKHS